MLKLVYYLRKRLSKDIIRIWWDWISKKFLDLGRGVTILGKSKLNWKRRLHEVNIPHRVFHYPQCDNDKICKQCEISPKKNWFECGLDKVCKNCLNKKTRIKFYSTDVNRLKRLPENEFGYIVPHYNCNLKKILLIIHMLYLIFFIWGSITV